MNNEAELRRQGLLPPKKYRRWNTVTPAKLAKFVDNNPGLTASMMAILWRRPYGTMSAALHGLFESGKLHRREEKGMRGGKTKAYRYYSGALGAMYQVLDNQ